MTRIIRAMFITFIMLRLRCVYSFEIRRNYGFSRRLAAALISQSQNAEISIKSDSLVELRKLMKNENLDAYIVPSDDPHMSEYTAAHYNRREFITGFTGSAGTAVVCTEKSFLWTDGR